MLLQLGFVIGPVRFEGRFCFTDVLVNALHFDPTDSASLDKVGLLVSCHSCDVASLFYSSLPSALQSECV